MGGGVRIMYIVDSIKLSYSLLDFPQTCVVFCGAVIDLSN